MKFVKKIMLFVFVLLILAGCGRDDDKIIMVTEAGFAPYEYYDNGEIVGVDVDIAKEIAKELGKELVIKDNLNGILLFDFFIFSWVPINFICLFIKNCNWDHIKHDRNVDTLNI